MKFDKIKCVVLAGGKGSRLSEYTNKIPKPMVKVGNKPLLDHIIEYYKYFGVKEFLIAGGYKYQIIKNHYKKKKIKGIKINVINTLYTNYCPLHLQIISVLYYHNIEPRLRIRPSC